MGLGSHVNMTFWLARFGFILVTLVMCFHGVSDSKVSACRYCLQETQFDPWVGNIPWSRSWQPTVVFLPRESHGQRSLTGYSPWGRKKSDVTEQPILFYFGNEQTSGAKGFLYLFLLHPSVNR